MRSSLLRLVILLQVAATLSVGMLACGNATSPAAQSRLAVGHDLSAQPESDGLRLRNDGDRPLYFAAFEYEWLTHGLFIWGRCTEVARCRSVAPRSSRLIPYSTIDGWTADAQEVQVYTWHLVPTASGYDIADSDSLRVTLR